MTRWDEPFETWNADTINPAPDADEKAFDTKAKLDTNGFNEE